MYCRYFLMTRKVDEPATIIMVELTDFADMQTLQRLLNRNKHFERPQTLQVSSAYKMDEEDMADLMETIIDRYNGAVAVDFFQYEARSQTRFI